MTVQVKTALLEGKAAALLQCFCLGAVFRELLSFRNNKIQHVDYTPHTHKKEKENRKKRKKMEKAKRPTNPTEVSIKNL